MGRTPIRAKLVLDAEAKSKLEIIAKSRTEGPARIARAKVLLAYHARERVTALAQTFQTNRPKTELKARIMRYLQDLNSDPVVFLRRYKLEEKSVSYGHPAFPSSIPFIPFIPFIPVDQPLEQTESQLLEIIYLQVQIPAS
jgi:hypothetical protein